MGPKNLYSVGDRVVATNSMMGPITPGQRGIVIEVYPGSDNRNTLVEWDVPEGVHRFACSDDEIDHLGVLDTLSEI